MALEECAVCGEGVPFAATVHLLVNDHEGVDDVYVCSDCYEGELAPLLGE